MVQLHPSLPRVNQLALSQPLYTNGHTSVMDDHAGMGWRGASLPPAGHPGLAPDGVSWTHPDLRAARWLPRQEVVDKGGDSCDLAELLEAASHAGLLHLPGEWRDKLPAASSGGEGAVGFLGEPLLPLSTPELQARFASEWHWQRQAYQQAELLLRRALALRDQLGTLTYHMDQWSVWRADVSTDRVVVAEATLIALAETIHMGVVSLGRISMPNSPGQCWPLARMPMMAAAGLAGALAYNLARGLRTRVELLATRWQRVSGMQGGTLGDWDRAGRPGEAAPTGVRAQLMAAFPLCEREVGCLLDTAAWWLALRAAAATLLDKDLDWGPVLVGPEQLRAYEVQLNLHDGLTQLVSRIRTTMFNGTGYAIPATSCPVCPDREGDGQVRSAFSPAAAALMRAGSPIIPSEVPPPELDPRLQSPVFPHLARAVMALVSLHLEHTKAWCCMMDDQALRGAALYRNQQRRGSAASAGPIRVLLLVSPALEVVRDQLDTMRRMRRDTGVPVTRRGAWLAAAVVLWGYRALLVPSQTEDQRTALANQLIEVQAETLRRNSPGHQRRGPATSFTMLALDVIRTATHPLPMLSELRQLRSVQGAHLWVGLLARYPAVEDPAGHKALIGSPRWPAEPYPDHQWETESRTCEMGSWVDELPLVGSSHPLSELWDGPHPDHAACVRTMILRRGREQWEQEEALEEESEEEQEEYDF